MANDLFTAMQAFRRISQAATFNTNEVALFYVLLHSWNDAHRPTVIEQWANTTSMLTGLDPKQKLPRARNTLIQKGIIFFEKNGNRGVPRYSFNRLFDLSNPFLGRNTGSKSGGKTIPKVGVNKEVSYTSYQVQGKEEEKEQISLSLDETGSESIPVKTIDEILTKLWDRSPKKARERSSKKQIKAAWKQVPKSDRPNDDYLIHALEAWKKSESWTKDSGSFVPGLHRWIKEQKWESLPEASNPQTYAKPKPVRNDNTF